MMMKMRMRMKRMKKIKNQIKMSKMNKIVILALRNKILIMDKKLRKREKLKAVMMIWILKN